MMFGSLFVVALALSPATDPDSRAKEILDACKQIATLATASTTPPPVTAEANNAMKVLNALKGLVKGVEAVFDRLPSCVQQHYPHLRIEAVGWELCIHDWKLRVAEWDRWQLLEREILQDWKRHNRRSEGRADAGKGTGD